MENFKKEGEKLKVIQTTPGAWNIENLTDEELAAIRNATKSATLPDSRKLYHLQELLKELPIF